MTLTPAQRQVFARVIRATLDARWYRAAGSGERVTLASLYRHGLVARRAWRGVEGQADAAHEYSATPAVMAAYAEVVR